MLIRCNICKTGVAAFFGNDEDPRTGKISQVYVCNVCGKPYKRSIPSDWDREHPQVLNHSQPTHLLDINGRWNPIV
jgi:hypothetical protein